MTLDTTYLKYFSVILIHAIVISGAINAQVIQRMEDAGIPLSMRFESSDYKGGMQCWSFDQDSTGILYVSNNNGLLEFDGLNWNRYPVPNSNKLRCVYVDSKNRIHVGGQGQIGYFERTQNGLVYESLMDLLPDGYRNIAETWNILESDDRMYFLTESQLLVFDGESIELMKLPGLPLATFEVNNEIWVQVYGQGLYRIFPDEALPLKNTSTLNEISEIFHDDGRYFLFTFDGNIMKYQGGELSTISGDRYLGAINSAIMMNNGDYAVGTHNNGLFILDKSFKIKRHYTKHKGISDRTVRALYEDNFNNLWVALNDGIDYLETSLPFALINDEVGLEGTGYAACVHDDQLYLGTNNGLFVLKESDNPFDPYSYELVPGTDGQVYNFSAVGGKLFMNHHHGAFVVNGLEIEQFHKIGSWKIMPTPVESLLIGGDYRGINYFRDNGRNMESLGNIPGFNESSRMFEFDSDTSLWMTHGSKGAFRFFFNDKMQLVHDVKLYDQNKGFPSNYNINIYPLLDKLVFTSEEGIYEYNREKDVFERNPFFDNWLGDNQVTAMAAGEDMSIYYVQNEKLGKLKHESFGNYHKDLAIFKHINHLISDDLTNITVLGRNHILIGGKEGFVIYYPEQDNKKVTKFNVLFRSAEIEVSADSVEHYFYPLPAELRMLRNQSIKIRFAAPFFEGYDELKYSYRLLPLDTNWSQWGTGGEERFSYLPANSYIFQVRAKNIYDQESPISSFSFDVVNPWYLSKYAIIGYIFLGVVIISLILLYQQKKYDMEKTLISENKDKVLRIKDKEISQISEDSRREIARLQTEKLRTEVNLKNDQLTTITMQMVNNNTRIQEALRNILVKIDSGNSRDELKRIIKSIENNIIKNDSWEQFEHHFDQVHGDYLKNLSMSNIHLSPREIKLAALLRMNLSSKEISKMMNITVRSVELARHRLRKKLKLERDQNLVEYLMGLDDKPT